MHMAHHYIPGHYGIRTKDYKLIFFYGLPLNQNGALSETTEPYWEFYDLKNDPKEMNNLYADEKYQYIIKELKAELLIKKQKLKDTDESYPELMEIRNKFWN